MRRLGRLSKLMAVLAALSLPLASFAPALAAEGDAVADRMLEGKILSDDGQAIQGAKIKVRNLDTGEEFTSAPTGGNGSYKLDNLPAGRYEIAVQTERGVYLGNRTVDLVNQTSQTYSFSLKNVPPEQALEEARRAREEDEGAPPAPPPTGRPPTGAAAGASKTSYWSNPWVATFTVLGIAIGAAIFIDHLDDDDDDGSPS